MTANEIPLESITRRLRGPELTPDKLGKDWSFYKSSESEAVMFDRIHASKELAELGWQVVPEVCFLLEDPNPMARILTMDAFRKFGEKASPALPQVVANLSHYDSSVVVTAIGLIAAMGSAGLPAAPALLGLIKKVQPAAKGAARHLSIWALQKLGTGVLDACPDAVEVLSSCLGDDEKLLRLNAAAAIGSFGPAASSALPALKKAMKHEDQNTRVFAARAAGKLGPAAKALASEITDVIGSISEDARPRTELRRLVRTLTGSMPPNPPEPEPRIRQHHWAGLDRKDFYLACHTPANYDLQSLFDEELCNALTFWVGHSSYVVDFPTGEQMKRWNLAAFWYYFTEDIFNPKCQRDCGFPTVTDFNLWMTGYILDMGRKLGKGRCMWSVGHEHMDAGQFWGYRLHGTHVPPGFMNKKAGYEFYRRWITTSMHKNHWDLEYGNYRPYKFYNGSDCGDPATWEFLAAHGIDASPASMMSGGVSPALAHASFEILPQIGWYWWECQVVGTSLQVGSAYVRGAARQYGKKWCMDVSPWSIATWFSKLDDKGENYSGVPTSVHQRSWTYGYLAGADCVLEESSSMTHFYYKDKANRKGYALSSIGKAAKEVSRFCFVGCPDRGQCVSPVGLLLEHEHGFEPCPHTNFKGKGPWYCLEMGPGEYEIERFWDAVYPGHSSMLPAAMRTPDMSREEIEPQILHTSAMGDVFDVITDRCSLKTMRRYPVIMTLGAIKAGKAVIGRLADYVKEGGRLVINVEHMGEDARDMPIFGAVFGTRTRTEHGGEVFTVARVQPAGAHVVLADGLGNPLILENAVGKGCVSLICASHALSGEVIGTGSRYLRFVLEYLEKIVAAVYPLHAETDRGRSPQYMLNTTRDGYLAVAGSHYRGGWQGRLLLRLREGEEVSDVTELWTQAAPSWRLEDRVLTIEGSLPEYSFGAYRVRLK